MSKYQKKLLFVEGGGCRGAYSYGVILALREIFNDPYLDTFDLFLGNSSGSMTLLYLLSGQFDSTCRKMYLEILTKPQALQHKNFGRLFNEKTPYLDVDYIIDQVENRSGFGINFTQLKKRLHKLKIPLINVNSYETEFFSANDIKNKKDLYKIAKAAISVIVLYDKCVQIGNSKYIDGGMLDHFQVQRKEYNNYKKLVISTGNENQKFGVSTFFMLKFDSYFGNLPTQMYNLVSKKEAEYIDNLKNLKKQHSNKELFLIHPEKPLNSIFDNSIESLYESIQTGYEETIKQSSFIKKFLK